jgi:predicted nucleotidyltransferase
MQSPTSPLVRLPLPEPVRAALARLVDGLLRAEAVRTVAVYGGVARGRFVAGRSDVNLLIVLRRGDRSALQEVCAPLRDVVGVQVEPMLVTADELPRLALVFPVKFQDICAHHVVLGGDPAPLATLQVPTTHARLRVEQELRNLGLRARRRFVELHGQAPALQQHLATLVRPFAIELASLLALDGRQAPSEDRTAAVFAAAAAAYALDAPVLHALAELRQTGVSGDPEQLYARLLGEVDRAAAAAARGA